MLSTQKLQGHNLKMAVHRQYFKYLINLKLSKIISHTIKSSPWINCHNCVFLLFHSYSLLWSLALSNTLLYFLPLPSYVLTGGSNERSTSFLFPNPLAFLLSIKHNQHHIFCEIWGVSSYSMCLDTFFLCPSKTSFWLVSSHQWRRGTKIPSSAIHLTTHLIELQFPHGYDKCKV